MSSTVASRGLMLTCAACGTVEVRTGWGQKHCVNCKRTRKNDYTRRFEADRRRAAGRGVHGSVIECGRCGLPLVKTGVNQKYCAPCSAAQIKDDSRLARQRHLAKMDEAGRERRRTWKRRRDAHRYRTEPGFALRNLINAGINQSLRLRQAKGSPLRVSQLKNGRHWSDLVGWSIEELRARLEGLFVAGMTGENRGQWHIDHIRPLASFSFTTPDDPQFREAWALTNLQPLWGRDNVRKGARYSA